MSDEIEAPTPQGEDKPDAPETGAEATEPAEPFSDKFDPASLPSELVPAYKQLQGAATKKFQEAARIRDEAREQVLREALSDPDFQSQAFQTWGIEVAGPDGQPPEGAGDDEIAAMDEFDALREQVGQLVASQQYEAQTQEAQAFEELEHEYIDSSIEELEESVGRKLDEEEANLVGNLAKLMRDEQGVPDVRGAYDQLADLYTRRQKAYVEEKRRAAQAPLGQRGDRKIDLKDPQQRRQAMAAAIEAERDAAAD